MKSAISWLIVGGAGIFLVGEIIPRRSTGVVSAESPVVSVADRTPAGRLKFVLPSAMDEGLRQLEAALNRASSIADANERNDVLSVACLRWAEFDPSDALRIARSLELGEVAGAVCGDILQKWAEKDFTGAFVWASREPAGELRDRLMSRLAYVEARTQPAAAARLVVEQIPAGAIQTEAGFSVLHQWALQDVTAAWSWANSFPAEMQARGRTEVANSVRFRLADHDAR